jgi:hypothetical protein
MKTITGTQNILPNLACAVRNESYKRKASFSSLEEENFTPSGMHNSALKRRSLPNCHTCNFGDSLSH